MAKMPEMTVTIRLQPAAAALVCILEVAENKTPSTKTDRERLAEIAKLARDVLEQAARVTPTAR